MRTLLILTCLTAAALAQADESLPTNRLADESSPYLLLHAHNPVNWYPWGPEAFEKARQENKPIFLSIGYSSCFWCHVMERKVFSNQKIADYMNKHFVNIKVDREERPDVDDIYMTSLLVYQQLTRSGGGAGWPLSIFLTPDGEPMAGATYLPPEDTPDGRTGFLTAATRIQTYWDERPEDMTRTAGIISAEVRRLGQPRSTEDTPSEIDLAILDHAVAAIEKRFDPEWGGVDFKPDNPNSSRFPNVPRLEFLLDHYERTGNDRALEIVTYSLTKMAHGGIRDHLGGGFHRYSTDRRWHVPHFEKMLYDQAMMLSIYSRCAAITEEPLYATVAGEIADFIHREMTLPDGGFCSALDAETDHIEGKYYVWSRKEVESVLSEQSSELFLTTYGFEQPNPFEHGVVLHLSEELKPSSEDELSQMRGHLLKARNERKRPLLDDKVLTAWNAMMIQSLARSGKLLDRPQDTAAAIKCASFLLDQLKDADGNLMRSWRNGQAKHHAYLDDYAFLTAACLELFEATEQSNWLTNAGELNEQQQQLFYSEADQAYFFTASNHEKLIARTSSVYDSVFPSGSSVAIRNLVRLSKLDSSVQLDKQANDLLLRYSSTVESNPVSSAGLASAMTDFIVGSHAAQSESSNDASTDVVTDQPALVATTQQPERLPNQEQNAKQRTFRPVLSSPDEADEKEKADKPLSVGIYPMYDKLIRGKNNYIAVELKVKEGWHVNSNPANPDYLVPTTVKLNTKQKVKLTRTKFPKSKEIVVLDPSEPYHVYDGTVIIYGLLVTDPAETADEAIIEFEIGFQACRDKECLPPDKIVLKGKLPIGNPGDPVRKINAEKFPQPKKKADDQASE